MRLTRVLYLGLLQSVMYLPACSLDSGSGRVIHLFNGRNLDGFYKYVQKRGRDNDPKQVFSVVDHMIRISGEEWGCITSNDEYANYRLVFEYKWGGKTFPPRVENARDSGLIVHSVGEDGAYGGIWMHGIEVQVIEGGAGDLIVVGDGSDKYALSAHAKPPQANTSRDWDPQGELSTIHLGRINRLGRAPGWQDVIGVEDAAFERPPGKWNRVECIVAGDEIHVMLNGKLVNHAVQVKPSSGRIQVQSEGAEIFLRRIDLIPLKAPPHLQPG
jgi:hypothetical protein